MTGKNHTHSSTKGRIGELRVAGELMSKGYLVFLPSVDEGLDIIVWNRAEKLLIPVQVRLSNYHIKYDGWGYYYIAQEEVEDLPKKLFVFILQHDEEFRYVIMPAESIKEQANKGLLAKDSSGEIRMWFAEEDNGELFHWESKKRKLNIKEYLNAWYYFGTPYNE
jgi:hypothetical protein